MNEKTKQLILLNCESYEFFSEQLGSIEKKYFLLLEGVFNEHDTLSQAMKERHYVHDGIFINKLKKLRECGTKYITTSIKFEKEMKEMRRLAPDLRDGEIEFEGVENKFLFMSDYLDELEQAVLLQYKMRECIEKQLKLFKGIENDE
jgi:hypothetical protein